MGAKKKKKSRIRKIPVQTFSSLNNVLNSLSESNDSSNGELVEDILYLLRSSPEYLKSPNKAAEAIINAVLPSNKIANDPEFEKVTGNPLKCKSIFVEVVDAMEINWDSFEKLPSAVADSVRFQIIEKIIPRFFTNRLRLESLHALKKYRLRKKRAGNKMDTAVAAALELILKNEKNEIIWPKIGLLHRIVENSLNFAEEFDNAMIEIMDKRDIHEIKNFDISLPKKEKRKEILNKIFWKLKENPKVRDCFINIVIDGFEEARTEVLQGKLNLGLLTIDELNQASEYIIKAIGPVGEDQLTDTKAFFSGLDKNKKAQLELALDTFIREMFTPEKLKQIIRKLDEIVKEPGDLQKWVFFIMMVRNSLSTEEPLKEHRAFLIELIIGELISFPGNFPNHEMSGEGS